MNSKRKSTEQVFQLIKDTIVKLMRESLVRTCGEGEYYENLLHFRYEKGAQLSCLVREGGSVE